MATAMARARYVDAFAALTAAYLAHVRWSRPQIAARARRRSYPRSCWRAIDGKSPAEYLTQNGQKDAIRAFAQSFIVEPVATVGEIARQWHAAGSA